MLPLGFITTCRFSFREHIIDEHHAMPDETIVADRYQLADKAMRLDLCTVADLYIFLYLGEWSNETRAADLASVNIHRLNDTNILPDDYIFFYTAFKYPWLHIREWRE